MMYLSTNAELDLARAQCRSMVTRQASLSAGAAIIPLPGIDIGTDVVILLRLLPAINRKFGLSPEQIAALDPESKKLVMVMVSALGSELIGRTVTKEIILKLLKKMGVRLTAQSASRIIPLVGQAFAAGLSFGAMRMLGNAHIEDCYALAQRAIAGTGPLLAADIVHPKALQSKSPS